MPSRPSQRPANARYYARNRDREIGRVRIRQAATLDFLRALRGGPCVDCLVTFEPNQMDFDHRDPSRKAFRLTAGRAMLMPLERLNAEAAMCDIVCANCHRIRTWKAHRNRLAARDGPRAQSPATARKRVTWQSQAELLDRLRRVGCGDCGQRLPPCAMDFDHRDGVTKTAAVTRMIGRAGTARILAEVAKCDIVCANCHRMRTLRRRTAQ